MQLFIVFGKQNPFETFFFYLHNLPKLHFGFKDRSH